MNYIIYIDKHGYTATARLKFEDNKIISLHGFITDIPGKSDEDIKREADEYYKDMMLKINRWL